MTQTNLTTRWTPTLVLEDALELFDDAELCERFKLSLGELTAVRSMAPYQQAVTQARNEIRSAGLTFKHKARLQAELLLEKAFDWASNVEEPLKDRLAVLTKMVEWGELEPKKAEAQQGNGFVFVVNMPGHTQTITALPVQQPQIFDNVP